MKKEIHGLVEKHTAIEDQLQQYEDQQSAEAQPGGGGGIAKRYADF